MNLFQAARKDRREMTSVWLARGPSLREFADGIEKPEHWCDRPVSGLSGAYGAAAAVLMEKMISLASERKYDKASALLPPYLFLRRHHLEMQLKSILRTVSNNSSRWSAVTGRNEPPDLYTAVRTEHSLLTLWNRVRPIAETVRANEARKWQLPSSTVTDISKLIAQLHAIDPRGDGVRYTRHNDGSLTMLDISRVDLEHTDRNMLDITEFLWWVRVEVGYIVIDHSKYVADDQGLKRDDVTMRAYLDEELAAGRSMGITLTCSDVT